MLAENMISIQRATIAQRHQLAPLLADFRKTLSALRGKKREAELADALAEITEYLEQDWPLFVADIEGKPVAYLLCRISEPCVWVEHLYVSPEHRRQGIANRLFDEAEKLAHVRGEETAYCYIHPNNHEMISFLRSRAYTVLNLIELRKRYRDEDELSSLQVGKEIFEY